MSVCLRSCEPVRMRAHSVCVRARVHGYMHACTHVRACVFARVRQCVRVCVCVCVGVRSHFGSSKWFPPSRLAVALPIVVWFDTVVCPLCSPPHCGPHSRHSASSAPRRLAPLAVANLRWEIQQQPRACRTCWPRRLGLSWHGHPDWGKQQGRRGPPPKPLGASKGAAEGWWCSCGLATRFADISSCYRCGVARPAEQRGGVPNPFVTVLGLATGRLCSKRSATGVSRQLSNSLLSMFVQILTFLNFVPGHRAFFTLIDSFVAHDPSKSKTPSETGFEAS